MVEMACIFTKESSRPLSKYQKQINAEAGSLAVADPSLLCKCGELLDRVREVVVEKGYAFVKGKSRSKRLSSSDEVPHPTNAKISADVRVKRILGLEEDIAILGKQILFKEKRRHQVESLRSYKTCEEIT